ncbi:MAG: 1-deoxy-D-xylulose-5-phosphate reductoisomerase [Deltaproteobacteria bacterium]|nr:1-deoxy-D-xylulose-5-phosphate reductoisomerase [Deltaproteobacteria bacterium]
MKKITILGSTGSIGVSTLDVIKNNRSAFEVCALAGGRNIALLAQQIERFRPGVVSVMDEDCARALKDRLGPAAATGILFGPDGYREVAAVKESQMVVSAMVGAAGLLPTVAAIEAGKDIALANKETMVMAGQVVCEKAAEKGVHILPVDSEHSAVFQCLEGHDRKAIRRIILTASGGPFRKFSRRQLAGVTPEQALMHPTWKMGKKITVDSASMMNKGLEIMEARWLFDVAIDRIAVLIHPQSVIHSLVEYVDGAVMAQLGIPDMRIPIAYALSYPDRLPRKEAGLDLAAAGVLEFSEPDFDRFPNLGLACEAGRKGGTMPAVLNGANEAAVEAFIAGRIGFMDMPDVIGKVLSRHRLEQNPSLDDILQADGWARQEAQKCIEEKDH